MSSPQAIYLFNSPSARSLRTSPLLLTDGRNVQIFKNDADDNVTFHVYGRHYDSKQDFTPVQIHYLYFHLHELKLIQASKLYRLRAVLELFKRFDDLVSVLGGQPSYKQSYLADVVIERFSRAPLGDLIRFISYYFGCDFDLTYSQAVIFRSHLKHRSVLQGAPKRGKRNNTQLVPKMY